MLKKTCVGIALAASVTLAPQVQATNLDELQAYLLELISFSDSKDNEPAQINTSTMTKNNGDVTIQNRPLEGEPEWEAP